MTDYFDLDFEKSIESNSGAWYKNIQKLGVGGNSVTFLVTATDGAHKGNLFALKVFRKLSKPERRKKFLREVDFLEETEHPAILRVFDSGTYYDNPFVVAEYLPFTLRERMKLGDLTTPKKLSFVIQLLSALAHIHSLETPVVHRDIRPSNIFIKGGSCVLGDFGLMKFVDGEEETDKDIFKESLGPGMPWYYRSPDLIEYANDRAPITTKSDVFQLGLVVAELFTERNPAVAPNDNKFEPMEMDKVSRIQGKLGGSIATLINQMLTIDPSERPKAVQLMDSWQANFFDAARHIHELEGEVL